MWITITGIEIKIFPDTEKACKYIDSSMVEPRVIGIVTEFTGNTYKTSVYKIDCNKL